MPFDTAGLAALLVDGANYIVRASPAAERFLLSPGSVDLFTALHPDLHAPLRQLLPQVFERGISQVSPPVELGPGRPRVVVAVSPYPAGDQPYPAGDQPLALVLLLVDEPDLVALRPELWDLGPTTLLVDPVEGDPSLPVNPQAATTNGGGAPAEPISQLQTDYTRLKETEARLRSPADVLDTALEASGMGWITFDVATGLVELDARARAISGGEEWPATVPAQQWMERVHPDDLEALMAELEAAEREDRHTYHEYRLQAGDGPPRLLQITGMYIRAEDGAVARWTGLVRDVTEERALEESLRRQARMLQLASEASGIGWGAYRPDTGLTEWDARGYEIMGFSGGAEERTQADFLARVHPEDRERMAAELARSKTTGGDYRREYRIIRPDGQVRDILGTGTYLVDESGKVVHGTGFLWDVTERKAQERALEERERSMRLAVEAGKFSVWERDFEQGTIRPISTGAVLSPPGEEPMDAFLLKAIHPDDLATVIQAAERVAEGGSMGSLEMRMLAPDGAYHWTRSYGELVRDANGKPVKLLGITVDIHDIKASEQELRRQAEMLRLASEAAGIGWSTSDSPLGPTYCDARSMEILGFAPEPGFLTAEQFLSQVHPDDRSAFVSGNDLGPDGSFHKEYRIVRPNGAVRDLVVDGAFIRSADGSNRGAAMLRDVTESKEQERELQERERSLRLAVEAANLSLWEWNPETDDIRTMVQLEGFPPIGPSATLESRLSLVHPDDRERCRTSMQEAVRERRLLNCEIRALNNEGAYRWFRMEGEPILDGDGRAYRLLGVSIDIQDHKESEQALKRWAETLEQRVRERTQEVEDAYANLQAAHRRFLTLFETSPVPTALFRLSDGIVLDANSALLEHSALRREDIVGHVIDAIRGKFDVDAALSIVQKALVEGRVSNVEHPFLHASGELRTYLVSVEPIEIDDQVCLLGSYIDITARKIAEEKVRELASQLTIAEQRERQHVSAILHDDLQQRLYALQLQPHWLIEMAELGDTDAILVTVADLLKLVPDTISVTRRLSVDLSPPILQNEGLAEAIEWLANQMREQYGLVIEIEATRTTRLMDEGLRILVFQVLRELLFNVVKHAGVLRVTVKIVQRDGVLTISVNDEGRGFDAPAVLEGRAGDGSGHGLAMNRQRLELVGGRMTVNSGPGAGTTIVITVPLSLKEGDGEGKPATE